MKNIILVLSILFVAALMISGCATDNLAGEASKSGKARDTLTNTRDDSLTDSRESCTDTDTTSVNPFLRGEASGDYSGPTTPRDYCSGETTLIEYSCGSNGVVETTIDCAEEYGKVCIDGACVDEPDEPDPVYDLEVIQYSTENIEAQLGDNLVLYYSIRNNGPDGVMATRSQTVNQPNGGGGGGGPIGYFESGEMRNYTVNLTLDQVGDWSVHTYVGPLEGDTNPLNNNASWYIYVNEGGPTCTDSDGGYYPLIFGFVIQTFENGSTITTEDSCYDSYGALEMTCNEDGTIFHNLVPCGMEYGEDYGCVDNVCASLNETANDNLSIRVDLDGDGTIDQSGVFYPELVVTDAHYINNSAPIFIHSRPDESFLRFSRVWRIDNSTNGTGYEVEFGHSEPYGFEVNETVATNASGEGTFYRHGTAHVFKVYQADGPFFRIRIDLHGNGQYTDYSSYYNGDFVWSEALGVEPGEDFLITYNYDYNVRLGGQLVRYLGYDGADNEVMFYDLVTHTGETVSLSGNSGTFYKQGHAFDFELVE